MSLAAPIRFRCFQCHKLLGVSRAKAGAVVACPQCSVELIVPEPAEVEAPADVSAEPTPAPAPPPPPPPRPSPSASRVEPVVVLWDTAPDPEGSSVNLPVFPDIRVEVEPISLRPNPPARRGGASHSRAATPAMAEAPFVLPPLDIPEPSIRDAVDVPGMTSSRGSLRNSGSRRDDVVLPRAAVMLWSFAMLVALAFAFAAGLLAGRFLWAPQGTSVSKAPHAGVSTPRIAALGRQPDCIAASAEV